MQDEGRLARARRRALRAAQVVTIGLALAGGGCSDRGDDPDATAIDSGGGDSGGTDSGGSDSGGSDSGGSDASDPDSGPMDGGGAPDVRVADAGDCARAEEDPDFDCLCPPGAGPGTDADCCEMSGGFWAGGGCAVPGPFVPPSMHA